MVSGLPRGSGTRGRMTGWESVAPQLKLIALDADGLAVISAHVQDARVQTADIIWRQGEKRLVVGMSRARLGADAGRRDRPAPPGRGAALRPGAGGHAAQHRRGDAGSSP